MELTSILESRVSRLVQAVGPRGGLYYPDAIQAVKSRYGFVKAPETFAEMDDKSGIDFIHGKYESSDGPIVIRRLQISDLGIVAETRVPTEQTVQFLEDLLQWVKSEFQIELKSTGKPDLFDSQLEVKLKVDIGGSEDEKLHEITQSMNRLVSGYGHEAKMRPVGMIFSFDPSILPLHGFTLDRRAGIAFSDMLYWSRAPFQTKDHLDILVMIENLSPTPPQ